MLYLILTVVLFVLSFVAGMLGLGVAFIATPVLGLFGFELKHVIMPWSLWLNDLAVISGAVAFARARMVDWRTATPPLIVTTIVAPVGAWLLRFVPTSAVWWMYIYTQENADCQNDGPSCADCPWARGIIQCP